MMVNGLFFASNIYVLGNTSAAIQMHDDLAPDTGPVLANTKVIVCFLTGVLFFTGAVGIIRKHYFLAITSVIGFILFDGLYAFQIFRYAAIHPRIWIDFSIFGSLSAIYGGFSWYYFKKRNS